MPAFETISGDSQSSTILKKGGRGEYKTLLSPTNKGRNYCLTFVVSQEREGAIEQVEVAADEIIDEAIK